MNIIIGLKKAMLKINSKKMSTPSVDIWDNPRISFKVKRSYNMLMARKYATIIGLIVLLTLLASFWYLQSPTKDPDLKTYRNDKYGFEFKYPTKFFLQHNGYETRRPTPHLEDIDISNYIPGKGLTWVARLNIRNTNISKIENLQYVYEEWMPSTNFEIISRNKTIINNKERLIEKTNDSDGRATWVHTINNNLLYTWVFSVTTTTPEATTQLEEVQKTILDSFKLTK